MFCLIGLTIRNKEIRMWDVFHILIVKWALTEIPSLVGYIQLRWDFNQFSNRLQGRFKTYFDTNTQKIGLYLSH